MEVNDVLLDSISGSRSPNKRRKICADVSSSCQVCNRIKDLLPTLENSDYYSSPSLSELAIREFSSPGYCSRVVDFTVGRVGYGCVKFFGETDVRCLDLDYIVKFNRCEVVVYEHEASKPVAGQGLNKKAEVTLLLRSKPLDNFTDTKLRKVAIQRLKHKTESQGAQFISFDPDSGEWKFMVRHFSRFGLSEDDEEDIVMNEMPPVVKVPEEMNDSEVSDVDAETTLESLDEEDILMNEMSAVVKVPGEMNDSEVSDVEAETALEGPTLLSHSLPSHLGLDPVRMKEMKMLMFPAEEDQAENFKGFFAHNTPLALREASPSRQSHSREVRKFSPHLIRKTPLALIEYNSGSFSFNSSQPIVMAQQNKGLQLKSSASEGFKLDTVQYKTPVTGNHSCNIADAALFMGRSFRVGWGPNGVFVHSGVPVGDAGLPNILSSSINLEKIGIDKVIRDENNKVKEELIELCFELPLILHKELNHEIKRIEVGNFYLKLQKVICDRLMLSETCRNYIEIIERQLELPNLNSVSRVLFMHQVMIWELIKVLFTARKTSNQFMSIRTEDEEDMMPDEKESYLEIDMEALPLIRRAEFSNWLQESVYHRVQEEVSSLDESSELEHIFLLLTGKQLEAAVELASSRGDIRLACLLSQAGGSTTNRADIAHQLDIWRKNGMDFNFFEEERMRLLELLSGNIHGALYGIKIDWRRFLGLLMWYHLPPNAPLPVVFNTYQKLLNDGNAPYPDPIYIDEGHAKHSSDRNLRKPFDLGYYLMLLHARQENDFGALKTMLSAFASTNDPLDYHMIWHQRAVLEAIGTFSSNDLHVLDMGFVSQLLCIGQCHWAIYVVLHMPHRVDYPYLQSIVIREILFQYCEVWSKQDSQWNFIENLGIPSSWLNEALAIYFSYHGDHIKSLHHFLACEHWNRGHAIFFTSVAHSLFLAAKHSEIWRLSLSMEDHKSDIEDWDLGAGIYISFYLLKGSLQEDSHTMTELDTLENKNDACTDFISQLNKSLEVWGSKLSLDARVVHSKMAEEICTLLLSLGGEGSTSEVRLSCFHTVFASPLLEDIRAYHLQDSISLFTSYLSQMAQ